MEVRKKYGDIVKFVVYQRDIDLNKSKDGKPYLKITITEGGEGKKKGSYFTDTMLFAYDPYSAPVMIGELYDLLSRFEKEEKYKSAAIILKVINFRTADL